MKRSVAMCLNKKIKDAKKVNKLKNVGRLSKEGFDFMMDELKNHELTLITFEALADIYDVKFKLQVAVHYNRKLSVRTLTEKDIVNVELDNVYRDHTGKELESACKCIREIIEAFEEINGEIIFE